MTDIVGHRGTIDDGVALLETFDGVMEGVLDHWNDDEGLDFQTTLPIAQQAINCVYLLTLLH